MEFSINEKYCISKVCDYYMITDINDVSIHACLRRGDLYEPSVLNIGLQYITNEDDIVFDVGANIGNHTVFWGRKNKNTNFVCVEPQLQNFNNLCANLLINGLTNVFLFNNPASCENNQIIQMPLNRDDVRFYGNFGGICSHIDYDAENFSNRKMKSVTLDSIYFNTIDLVGKKISLIKIDTEGFEYNILKGAERIISEHSPKILFEAWPGKEEELFNLLNKYGYSLELIAGCDYIACKK